MSGRALRPQGPSCRPALPHSSRPVSQSFQGTNWSSRLFAGPCALLCPAWPGRSVAVRPPDAVGQSRGLDARQSPSSCSGCSVTAQRAAAHTGLSPPAPPRARFQRRQPGTLGTHHGAARGTKLATGVTSESPSSSRETCFQMSTASLSPAVGPPETAVPATARDRPPPMARQRTAGVRVGGMAPPAPYLQHGGGARGKFVEGFDSLQAHEVESVHVSNEAAERKVSTGRASGFRESGDRGPRIPAERNRNAAGAASPRGRSAPPPGPPQVLAAPPLPALADNPHCGVFSKTAGRPDRPGGGVASSPLWNRNLSA